MSDKLKLENTITDAASAILTELYGDFDRIPDQTDRPDAAIKLKSRAYTIGIEITTTDRADVLEYFNDKGYSSKFEKESMQNCLNGIAPERPLKKLSIPTPRHFLFEALNKKTSKYKEYNAAGKFNELIILTFSDSLSIENNRLVDYLFSWTNHYLSKINYPFSKVIFVCREEKKGIVIYDKNKKKNMEPKRDVEIELGFTKSISGWCPIKPSLDIGNIFESEPTIKPRSLNKKNQKKKNPKKRTQRK